MKVPIFLKSSLRKTVRKVVETKHCEKMSTLSATKKFTLLQQKRNTGLVMIDWGNDKSMSDFISNTLMTKWKYNLYFILLYFIVFYYFNHFWVLPLSQWLWKLTQYPRQTFQCKSRMQIVHFWKTKKRGFAVIPEISRLVRNLHGRWFKAALNIPFQGTFCQFHCAEEKRTYRRNCKCYSNGKCRWNTDHLPICLRPGQCFNCWSNFLNFTCDYFKFRANLMCSGMNFNKKRLFRELKDSWNY